MITLTWDKLLPTWVGFPIKGPVHQEPGPSTPMQGTSPGDFAPHRENGLRSAPAYTVRHDITVPVRGLHILACQP
jgi:hypothetical protein